MVVSDMTNEPGKGRTQKADPADEIVVGPDDEGGIYGEPNDEPAELLPDRPDPAEMGLHPRPSE
jgi:hypothetical protein